MKFILIHGAFGSPNSNWYPELKEKLISLGHEVISPQFPVEKWNEVTQKGNTFIATNQNLTNWLVVFEKEVIPNIQKSDKLCFVGHSLAPLFILHVVSKYNIKLDSAIFVSPFMDRLNRNDLWQFDLVNKTFYKTDFDFEKIKKLISVSYVLYSSNDPYVEKNHSLLFAHAIDSSSILVKKAGHMNSEVNLNEFPLIYELCKTRIDLTLYQRYLEHRKDLFATNYFKGKHEEVVYLEPEEIFEEGKFHFRNLTEKGFCTFLTSLDFWDTQAPYYEEARRAAQRVKEFIRVFVIDKIEDLQKPLLLKQMENDMKSNIKIYLVMLKDISSMPEPDFGIWDNEYVCIVSFKKHKQIEVKLSSRKKDIEEAEKWKKYILQKSVQIYNLENDISAFIKSHN